ncbi:hypothetical protein EJ02DRAFT_101071 [Clathrospora elynae]|uniref:Uncharacterized protein n=1 Tax=Clathrospora elynae TaxID=706981 RepID=A0A6A5S8R3_9PLEO|nr:hypothetical protein EJ02DRAFT_101071 [Clathrospora elynae]
METRRSGGQTGRRLGITTTPTDEPANTRKYPGNYKASTLRVSPLHFQPKRRTRRRARSLTFNSARSITVVLLCGLLGSLERHVYVRT